MADRPTGGKPICTNGTDRKCGPARKFGPWRVPEADESPTCSAHFCVHWVPRTRDAPHLNDRDGDGAPNYVETVLEVAEHTYVVMVDRLGWHPPRSDGDKGGDARTDFYLFNTDQNTRAAALAISDAEPTGAPRHRSGWVILDDDYDDPLFHGDAVKRVLQYYVPHELHHIFQVGYDYYFDAWVFEATAEWITSVVYPHPQFFAFTGALGSTSTQPLYRFGYRAYSLATWNSWIADRLDPSVIRRVWELADQYPRDRAKHSVEVYDRAIREASRGRTTFAREFVRYATATAEWSPRDFDAGNHFADIDRKGKLRVDGDSLEFDLGQAAWAHFDVRGIPAQTQTIELTLSAPEGVNAGVALVGADGRRVERSIVDLRGGGTETLSLAVPRGGFDRVTAVLVNPENDPTAYRSTGKPRFFLRASAG